MVDTVKGTTVIPAHKKLTSTASATTTQVSENGSVFSTKVADTQRPGQMQEIINSDWESGILTREDSKLKFFGKPLDHKYIFNYQEYVKRTGDKNVTIGQIQSRYKIPDGVLRKGELSGFPGHVEWYKLSNYPELQKFPIPKECIEKYVPEDSLK